MSTPLILCIETATKMCSVALYKGDVLLSLKEQGGSYAHAENLTIFIEEVVNQANILLKNIDAIAVSKGPGSYTGLRIGVSTAKGLAFALQKPIIAVETLFSMANLAANEYNSEDIYLCPMIDARRMEVYCAIYDSALNLIKSTSAEIIYPNIFDEVVENKKMIFFGDGAPKCKEVFKNKSNYIFSANEFISAKGIIQPALKKWSKKDFEDLAYFEPYYLKEFITVSSKNNKAPQN